MQFARDAYMAERWMVSQEPQLKTDNVGVGTRLLLRSQNDLYPVHTN